MQVLTVDNDYFDLDTMPEQIHDVKYCVLDFGKDRKFATEPDFYFNSLIFMEKFSCPAAVLSLGEYNLKVPLDWNILVTGDEFDEMCMMPISSILKRGFKAFAYNPLGGGMPQALAVDIMTVFRNNEWYLPKLNNANVLAVPLTQGIAVTNRAAPCVFISDETYHIPKNFSLTDIM